MSGWIKLHRKITEWEWYDDIPARTLWFHLLVSVNYEAGYWRGKKIAAGQIITGRKKLAKATGLSEQQIRRVLKNLQNSQQINIETTKQYSIISIVNWKLYQQDNLDDSALYAPNKTTIKETKKIKKKEKKEGGILVPIFIDGDLWMEFVAHKGGSKFTQRSAKMVVNKLTTWHGDGHDVNEILRTTIMNGWKGVFLPKNVRGNQNGQSDTDAELARYLAKSRA